MSTAAPHSLDLESLGQRIKSLQHKAWSCPRWRWEMRALCPTKRAVGAIQKSTEQRFMSFVNSIQTLRCSIFPRVAMMSANIGFNLTVGRLSRTPHGTFPEYHTSADNMSFVHPHSLSESYSACEFIFSILERNRTYLNTNAKGEPQLGKRGLYRAIGGPTDTGTMELAMLWVLNLSDGSHSLLDIAERPGIRFESIHRAALALREHHLLREKFEFVATAAG